MHTLTFHPTDTSVTAGECLAATIHPTAVDALAEAARDAMAYNGDDADARGYLRTAAAIIADVAAIHADANAPIRGTYPVNVRRCGGWHTIGAYNIRRVTIGPVDTDCPDCGGHGVTDADEVCSRCITDAD